MGYYKYIGDPSLPKECRYIGGTLKEKLSLHDAVTGKRVTQSAKPEDCTILTRIAWRTTRYAGVGRRHSSPG
jgi:hypothetical protein